MTHSPILNLAMLLFCKQKKFEHHDLKYVEDNSVKSQEFLPTRRDELEKCEEEKACSYHLDGKKQKVAFSLSPNVEEIEQS